MLALFETAPGRGVEIADFGYGDDQYKKRFASGVHTVSGGGVGQPTRRSSTFALSKS